MDVAIIAISGSGNLITSKLVSLMMLTGAILSGGRSVRMGHEKGLTLLGGEPFIFHVRRAMEGLVDEVIVSVAKGMAKTYAEALGDPFIIVEDETPGIGPLGGIIPVLSSAKSQYVLFSPCDTPFLNPKVCELIVSSAHGADGVVPKTGKTHYEPLHGMYKKEPGLVAFTEIVSNGDGSPQRAFDKLDLSFIPEEKLRKVDPELESFWNINTLKDVELAESKLRAKRQSTLGHLAPECDGHRPCYRTIR
jgi:molybdenum cofactor guanylyltransferase